MTDSLSGAKMTGGTMNPDRERPDEMLGRLMAETTKAKYSKPQPVRGFLARFPRAVLEVSKVSQYGTEKHEVSLDDVSYKSIPDAEHLYAEAEVRHLLAEAIEGPLSPDGREVDPRIELLHKAQKAWNAMADLEVFLENWIRPTGSGSIRFGGGGGGGTMPGPDGGVRITASPAFE